MTEGVELATVWVRVVPTLDGVQESITEQFMPGQRLAEDAGDKAGKGFGTRAKAGMAAAGIGIAVGAAFKGLYDVGATFDDITDTIRVGTGAQGDALDGLVDVAKDVGATVPAEFDKIGPVVADLNTRLGLSGDTLTTVASQYLEAGRILGEEVDIGSSTAALNAFGISGGDVSGALDTMFQVSQATGVGMNELASGVQAQAPALQALGFNLTDSVALLGSLDKAGLNAEGVMGSLSKGLVNLAKDGEEPQAAFQRVTDELQGFVDTGDTASALDLASQVFGTKGATQFVGALQSGVLNMDDLMGAVGATGDTILGVGDDTADFAEKWQVVMNQAMVAVEPLATAIFTGIGDALTGIMPSLQLFGEWIGDNPVVIQAFAAAIAVLTIAFIGITIATWAMNTALLLNPFVWIAIAVIALIAAIVLLIMNWDSVVSFITDVWSGFLGWFTGVMDGFLGWWGGVWDGFLGFITDTWNNIVTNVTGFFNLLWAGLQIIGAAVLGWWNGLWQGIFDFFGGIWGGILDTINTVQTAFGLVFNAIAGIIRGAFEGVVGFVRDIINGISSSVNGIIDGINGVAGAVGGAIGVDLSIPHIPMLADGGTITRSGYAIVGERGPEMVRLPAGAQVDPDIDPQAGGSNTYQFIAAPGMDEGVFFDTAMSRMNFEGNVVGMVG
jgi:phage-related minor tail protein